MNEFNLGDQIFLQDSTENSAVHVEKEVGHSFPLCSKIIESLRSRSEYFHMKTLCVLGHNTKKDSYGNTFPIISGFLVGYLFLSFPFLVEK